MTINRLFLAVMTAKLVSVAGLLLMPIQVGALIDGLQLGEAAAGLLATLEFSGLGAGLLFTAGNPLRTSARNYALIGVMLILTGQILSALIENHDVLMALRFLVGFGAGFANAAATITIAAHFREPEKTAGYAFCIVYVIGMAMYLGAPSVSAIALHKSVFIGLALVVLLFSPMLFALPNTPLKKKTAPSGSNDAIVSTASILLFIAEVFVMIGMGAAWAFGERLGLAIELTPREIGFYFALTMVSSIVGSFFVGWVGVRFGRTVPFVLSTVLVSICCYLLATTDAVVVFVACLLLFQAFQAIFIPMLIGTGAALETSGRLSAAVVAVEIFSFGAGGYVGGYVAENFGLSAIGWVAIIGGIVAIPIFVMVCLPLDRGKISEQRAAG